MQFPRDEENPCNQSEILGSKERDGEKERAKERQTPATTAGASLAHSSGKTVADFN